MTELKPCPFCGRTPTVDDCGEHRYFVRCKCGIVQDKLYMQKCDAVRRWNTRKIDKDTNVPSNDCISRQAAIDALRMDIDIIPYAKAREYARAVIETVYNRLENLPSAQPQRMRGRWIYKNELKQFFCSECGYPSLTYDDTYIYGMDLPNYCEDCGADMRGEQDG